MHLTFNNNLINQSTLLSKKREETHLNCFVFSLILLKVIPEIELPLLL